MLCTTRLVLVSCIVSLTHSSQVAEFINFTDGVVSNGTSIECNATSAICTITCTGEFACSYSTITCPTHNENAMCNLYCSSDNNNNNIIQSPCKEVNFVAEYTVYASVTCQSSYGCWSMTISHNNTAMLQSPILNITTPYNSNDSNQFYKATITLDNNVTGYFTSNTYLGFSETRINGLSAKSITVDCGYDNNDYDELINEEGFCKDLYIGGSTLTEKLVIKSGANGISYSDIYCPDSSNKDACQFLFQDVDFNFEEYNYTQGYKTVQNYWYATNGLSGIKYNCSATRVGGLDCFVSATIYCSNYSDMSAACVYRSEWINNSYVQQCGSGINSDQECIQTVPPTPSRTFITSQEPVALPSTNPTKQPTSTDSMDTNIYAPSRTPTLPTHTLQPTMNPTTVPTDIRSIDNKTNVTKVTTTMITTRTMTTVNERDDKEFSSQFIQLIAQNWTGTGTSYNYIDIFFY